jgi:hypothetical protein
MAMLRKRNRCVNVYAANAALDAVGLYNLYHLYHKRQQM